MQKSFLPALLIAFLIMLSSSSTNAALYEDYVNIETILHSGQQTVGGTFDISDSGFSGTAETIYWADVQFVVYDSDSNRDLVRMTVGGEYSGGGAVRSGFNLFGGSLYGEALLDLSADGKVNFTIQWLSGDAFRVSEAALTVETGGNAVGVPEGGSTAIMLGLALLGFGGFRRKLQQ